MDINQDIAEAIRTRMTAAGTTPTELSRATGIPRTTFNNKLNRGGWDYTAGELKRIANALGTHPTELLGSAA